MVEHPFRVIQQQFGLKQTRLRGMAKNRCKIDALAARINLFLARHQLLLPSCLQNQYDHRALIRTQDRAR